MPWDRIAKAVKWLVSPNASFEERARGASQELAPVGDDEFTGYPEVLDRFTQARDRLADLPDDDQARDDLAEELVELLLETHRLDLETQG
jgi:hypothetical protein